MTRRPLEACPDWRSLVAARDADRSGAGAAEDRWRAALDHLRHCGDCRRPALDADPGVLFQSLPRVEVGAAEVAVMRQAVASMRRADRVAPGTASPAGTSRWRQAAGRLARASRHGRGLAAAALLALAGGGVWVGLGGSDLVVPAAPPALAADAPADFEGVAAPAAVEIAPASVEPVFMDLSSSPRAADVYRMGDGGGLQVVMVVDETLDV